MASPRVAAAGLSSGDGGTLDAAREGASPGQLYTRTRYIFLVFSLVTTGLLFVDHLFDTRASLLVHVLVAVVVGALSISWWLEYQGESVSLATEVAQGTGILALCLATAPLYALVLVYARISLRALDQPERTLLPLLSSPVAGYLAGVAAYSLQVGSQPGLELLFLAMGFPLAAVVMRTISLTLRTSERLAAVVRESELNARLGAIVHHASDLILMFEEGDGVAYASPSVARALGGEEIRDVRDVAHPEDAPRVSMALEKVRSGGSGTERVSFRLRSDNGNHRYVEALASAGTGVLRDGAVVMTARDMTEQRQLDDRLRHQAFHDGLTGLANRALFRDRVEHALSSEGRRKGRSAVVFIDLDDFKTINDSVGHTAGDAVLVEVAHRIAQAVRPADTAARLGGDEFAVLVEGVPSEAAALRLVNRIRAALTDPITAEDDVWFISGSLGVAFTGDGGRDVDALLRSADVAMYDAKRRGRGHVAVFEPAMHQAVLDRMALETDLRRAVAAGELSLVYQPQFDLATNLVVGVEALLRWTHPQRGPVAPSEFIPLAEESGIVGELDHWVVSEAARQARTWADAGLSVPVGVNVSGKEFADPNLAERIRSAVREAGASPTQIELEVTESAAFEMENARATLTELRNEGFRVAIDDFGVGFSMLGRLQDLDFDRLKIDRSFIEKVTFGEDEAPIVSGIIAMAHSLSLRVVAEGIETSEQLRFLRRNGCDQGQGYRLGRPMQVENLDLLLRERAPARKVSA